MTSYLKGINEWKKNPETLTFSNSHCNPQQIIFKSRNKLHLDEIGKDVFIGAPHNIVKIEFDF